MSRQLCTLIVLAVFGTTPLWAGQLSLLRWNIRPIRSCKLRTCTTEQRVYVTPTKERRETLGGSDNAGEGSIQIFRRDSKVMWQLMPSEKMYMEHSMGKAAANDVSQWDFEETVMGEEVLNGVKVTKYKTIATSTDGKKYGGFSWRTKEGISIKTGSVIQGREREDIE